MATETAGTQEQPGQAERYGLSGRIHMLGIGNVGGFVAHALASNPSPPPITLLLQDPVVYQHWMDKRRTIGVESDGLDSFKTGFDTNVFNNKAWYSLPEWALEVENKATDPNLFRRARDRKSSEAWCHSEEENSHIDCLIVTCKAPQTLKAIMTVKHRLSRDSTVLFLQNGMGVIEQINDKVFPFPEARPHYISGIISHGLMRKSSFHVQHKAIGTTILSPVPDSRAASNQNETDLAPTTKYLLRTLNLTPQLVATTEPPSSMLQFQLEKLAMNCVINPLAAIFGCNNGELLYNFSITRVMRLLLFEISTVICALPELKGVPGIEDRFSAERLRRITVHLANKTARNKNSMLQDVEMGRVLEVDFLNGYIVRRGEELGIKCVMNYMIEQMVIGKHNMLRQKEEGAIPVDVSASRPDQSE